MSHLVDRLRVLGMNALPVPLLLAVVAAACGAGPVSNPVSGDGGQGGGFLGLGGGSAGSTGGGSAGVGGGSGTAGGFAGVGGGTTAGGGTATGGSGSGGGGTSTGQHELSDGSLGSSCGTCTSGLACAAQATNGYCTKSCSDSSQCPGGYCYNTTAVGPVCLRACQSDLDCRPGYSCQGTAGTQGCYPGASTGTGGGTGSGTFNNASLNGCYWMNGDITYRYHFDGVGSFDDISWNSLSGTITKSGAYGVSGASLTLQYSGGTTENHTLRAGASAAEIYIDNSRYVRSGAVCE